MVKLKSSLRKFYGHHNDWVNRYGISVSQMTTLCSICRNHNTALSAIITFYRIYDISYSTGVTSGAWTAYTSISHCCLPAFCGCPFFSFLWNALYCFHLVIILSVMWFKASDYNFWIFKLKTWSGNHTLTLEKHRQHGVQDITMTKKIKKYHTELKRWATQTHI